MLVYSYDRETKEFVGTTTADESPREPGVFLMPAHTTTEAPPEPEEGFSIVFVGGGWQKVAIPEPPTDFNRQILETPSTLFGGPTLQELFR